ncbi:lipoate--protein ligase family protein [Bythopirellula goksoeyrii]|uniref:Octanoyltransferase LipM n=1 Tax=Bythopirellula goksoeyrii TaxID=1400387 RepID=A0A5B9QDR8_9BACT|nr:lipoate--protein ligase [Bythopirellula goksoeyrii]QEG37108.1 Octanoyltransferase LipM [Bythopirellula goksoeyrii]
MSDAHPGQLILDPPGDGAWNMAVDEALLHLAAEEGIATLRFYQWQEPTLSLGYFQQFSDRHQHPASLSATVVRRQSGGGAILHDQELTYSISLPATHPFAKNAQSLYDSVHTILVSILKRHLSNASQIRLWEKAITLGEDEPFLCFQRRALGDIVLDTSLATSQQVATHKIVGSAQRRNRGAVLQHGSILLDNSPHSPELPGVNDLCGSTLSAIGLTEELRDILPPALALSCLHVEINRKVHTLAERWYNEKYGRAQWTTRR